MKLTPIDFAEYREASKFYRSTKIQRLIEEFERGEHACARVSEPGRKPDSIYCTIHNYLKRSKKTNIIVSKHQDIVYLINKTHVKDEEM